MRVGFDGGVRRAPAVDLRGCDVDADEAVAAVRDRDDDRVACGPPAPVHERVGVLTRDCSVSRVAALAEAARTWGAETDHDGDLRAVERQLRDLDVPDVDLESARERVAETALDVERLRERVARTSGAVAARRDLDADPADAEADMRAATSDLAEAETEHHAAREALAAERERAREARDARERRLELEDERDNRQRAARRALADEWADSFRRAVRALPVPGEPARPAEFAGPDWAAACAVARVAKPGAPLVVESRLFDRATRARAALRAPVLLVEV